MKCLPKANMKYGGRALHMKYRAAHDVKYPPVTGECDICFKAYFTKPDSD